MGFSHYFVERPVATALATLGVVLASIAGYLQLPVASLPQVDFPTIQVSTSLPGASAETIAATVAAPLEQVFQQIPGLTQMTSTSTLGRASITLQFDLARNIDAAAQDVQAAINAAGGSLPRNLPSPPAYHKVNPAQFKVLTLAVTSDTLPLRVIDEYANTFLVRPISQLPGVGLVDLNGEQKPAIRVQINPVATASLGLSLEDVRAALQTATVNGPKGTVSDTRQSITLDTNDQLLSGQAADELIVAYHNGAPIRVRDIGRAISGVENVQVAGWYQSKRAILVDVHLQPGANLVQVIDAIRSALPDLTRELPPAMTVSIIGDRSLTVRAAIGDMKFTLAITVALVVLVIFLFLRKLWLTLIPSIAIPISLICAGGAMYLLGYSLDNLSFMGLTIAVGFLVDDAIVMIENITRHIEAGEQPVAAASNGAREITFTIISMTTSLIAVFIPLLLMGGITGRLFREFSVTVAVALIVSALVSLTLTPMMCGRLMHLEPAESESRIGRYFARAFDRLLGAYRSSLQWVLTHAPLTLGAAFALLAATIWLFAAVPKGFIPQQDVGIIVGSTESAADSSFTAMARRQEAVIRVVLTDPDVEAVSAFIEPSQLNTGRIYIHLKPFDRRRSSVAAIIDRLQPAVARIGGVSLAMQAVQDVQIGGRLSRTQYQYTLQDANLGELYEWAPVLTDQLRRLPQVRDVATDLQAMAPHARIVVDRDTAARLGITSEAIDETLYDAFGQRQVATLFTQVDQFHIVLEVDPSFQLNEESLARIYVRSSSGQLVPLNAFSRLGRSVAPLSVNHQGQFPAVTISFNLAPGVSLGEAIGAIDAMRRSAGIPTSVHLSFQGAAQAFQASLASEPYLILAAIIAVYIVLGILYESTAHPVTILSTLPSAGAGALIALILTGNELNVVSLVGIILLIGIVKKNAIMMIDFAIAAQRLVDRPAREVIFEAALLRFRPIMMTTVTALLGSLPLALGLGAGSELRRPLGIAVVGGLLVSQLLTLYTTPVIFIYMEQGRAALSRGVRWFRARSIGYVEPIK
jgi:hydrophobe/amphiphile efflux-1 (HAE1) family protein